ncbi:protein cordon-bleu, partial [Plakobranchus ocellatus]
MSQAGKFRPNGSVNTSNNNDKISMPSSASLSSSSPVTGVKNNNINSKKDTTALNGTSLTQGSEVSAGAGTPRPESLITLDVLLPSGQHTDITVDWSTPMLDLLVSLAGKCRVNPTGLSLQLLDPDTRLPLTYKPNQTIGSLGGREVRLVPRDESSNKTKSKGDRKQEKPFEITHRFTMNLPRGQKTVVRVSPLITLGQLMTTVCEDKSLDLRRHVLQIPGQPGIKVDLGSTIQELGLNELNLVAVGLQDPRSHMVSMPDLSKPPPSSTAPPSYMPMAGEFKKKRGFLSFLSKNKDKKYRTQNMETSSTTSHMARNPYPPTSRQATTPPAERREFSEAPHRPHHPESRPKTMFVTAAPQQAAIGDEHSKHPTQHQLQQQDQTVDITAGTAKKKRRAPAPPGPSSTLSLPSIPSMVPPEEISQAVNGGHSVSVSPPHKEQQQTSRAELLSRLHSRNSSDSSGYHELTLSGAESPEAPGHLEHHTQQQAVAKLKSSIDTTSIESGQDGSGANGDSGIHDLSPTRVSPIEEVIEKPNQTGTSVETSMSIAKKSVTATASGGVGGKKKRKAPAPPVSAPSLQPLISSEMANLAFSSENQTTSETANSEMKPDGAAERTLSRDAAEEIYEETSPQEASTPRQSDNDELDTHSEKQDFAIQDNTQGYAIVNDLRAIADSHDNYDLLNADKHSDDEDAAEINTAFDIDAILEGVVFDEEPKPMELQVVGSSNHEMVMEETGSIISETVEQVESDRHERPCAFIPPPPPDEPPPPEVEPVQHIIGLTRKEPVLVDKGTGVNEDNTSLAPSSAKSSPGA